MLRIVTLSAIVLAATVMQACVPGGDDLSGGGTEASDPSKTSDSASDITAQSNAPEVVANATSADCGVGNICFYSGPDLTGSICKWSLDDPDWGGGNITCRWAASQNVCSVWNRSRGNVEYFTATNFTSRIGSTNPSIAGNLTCTYKLRSHRCSSTGACW